MKNYRTIHDLLEDWGKSKQKSPANNAVLKNAVLNKLPNVQMEKFEKKVRTPMPWLSFAFATMAIVVVVGNSLDRKLVSLPMATTPSSGAGYSTARDASVSNTVLQSSKSSIAPEYNAQYYPDPGSGYYYGEPPISDEREFLKTYYNSTLRTRHVTDTKTQIEIIVRGFGGRIDGSSSAEKQGYVSFAIPANKFEAFRQEVKSLAGSKLYIENISTENLLPQKQAIEEQQDQTEKYISGLKSERTKLINSHNQAIASHNSRINALNQEIALLQIESGGATAERKIQISARIIQLQTEITAIQGQVGSENKNYQNRLANINSQLKSWEMNLDGIKKQDKNLMENVATVNGNISLSWISLWELSDIYTPGPLLAWLLLVAALIAYKWHRRYLEIII